jgi:hypothetical protein
MFIATRIKSGCLPPRGNEAFEARDTRLIELTRKRKIHRSAWKLLNLSPTKSKMVQACNNLESSSDGALL